MNTRANGTVPISAVVTAFQRIEQTLKTLRRLEVCRPRADEILVHVDGNEVACANAIRAASPQVRVITSETSVGPGGGRNRLVAVARNELIASFDDDSYPIDTDYFWRAKLLAESFPDAALFAASVFHKNEDIAVDEKLISPTASFSAGGVIFRRSEFTATSGFIPLAVAYAMEEEDLALQLLDRGRRLLHSPWLRVFHDTDRGHHNSARITSAVIANLALLAWLRYPASYWPYAALQVTNRIVWCLRAGRYAGVLSGIAACPSQLARHRGSRNPVSKKAMRQRFALRKCKLEPFTPAYEDPPV